MKFVAIINGKKTGAERVITFITDGPVPTPVEPPDPDEEKDTAPPKPEPGEQPS